MAPVFDFSDSDSKKRLFIESAKKGDVFRKHLTEKEGIKGKNPKDDGRNKFFVFIGFDSDYNILGCLMINSHINQNLSYEVKLLHYPIAQNKHPFLTHNSHIDCSKIHRISLDSFIDKFNYTAEGNISENDYRYTIEAVKSSSTIMPAELKMFGLL